MGQSGGRGGGGRSPTTAPPPFDPEQYARDSEVALRVARPVGSRSTAETPSPPPLNRRVHVTVPPSDLAWFDLSEVALELAGRIDGSTTLLELIEGADSGLKLEAVAQLHDAGLLAYED